MDILNSIDSAAFVNHLAAHVPALYRDMDDTVRASSLNTTRKEANERVSLGFPRETWVQSWAVAPF